MKTLSSIQQFIVHCVKYRHETHPTMHTDQYLSYI